MTALPRSPPPAPSSPAPVGLRHVTPLEEGFPSRLRSAADPPASISLQGGAVEAPCTVAVVGSRAACEGARTFARELAGALAQSGAVVVSGGAVGIDAAAHEGALGAGGRTWAVAGTGHTHCFPLEHAGLFERIGQGPGAMVWPFPPQFKHRGGFIARNRVLVTLSDAVVVVQAGAQSGALNAASRARQLGKPLWVVPAAPWMEDFAGSRQLLASGARPLGTPGELLAALGLVALAGAPSLASGAPEPHLLHLPPDVSAVFHATPSGPSHFEAIASASDQTVQVAMAALLTLSLENVVVEGPPGFFRRNIGRKY